MFAVSSILILQDITSRALDLISVVLPILSFYDVPNKDANGNLDGSGKGVLSAIRKTDTDQLQVVLRVLVQLIILKERS